MKSFKKVLYICKKNNTIKKLVLFALLFSSSLFAQPENRPPHGPNHPPCNGPNPPNNPFCNPVPIDDYLPLLLILAIGYGSYVIHKNHKKLKKC